MVTNGKSLNAGRLVAGAALSVALLGATFHAALAQNAPPPPAQAQPGGAPPPPPERSHDRPKPSPADRKAFLDARIAAVKAGLQLTPDQEKLWPQAETAVRAFVEKAEARRQARRAQWEAHRAERRAAQDKGQEKDKAQAQPPAEPDVLQRMRARADAAIEHGQSMKAAIDGVAPLYASLSPEQKGRLRHLVGRRMWREHEAGKHGGWRGDWNDEGPRGHRGHGRRWGD